LLESYNTSLNVSLSYI